MSHPYFFIQPSLVTGSRIILSDREDLRHLCGVLRCRPGDLVYFSDNKKNSYRAKTISIDKDKGIFDIEEKYDLQKSMFEKVLFQCVLKKNAMEIVIQKATEIGADIIVPVISSRVVSDIADRNNKIKRWQKIADEASKQSRRHFKCSIGKPVEIEEIDLSSYDLFYIPHEETSRIKGKGLISGVNDLEHNAVIGFLTGPEGGLTGSEISGLEKKGAITTGLGRNILRAETASIYFLSVLDFLIKAKNII